MPEVAFCILIGLLEYREASVHEMSAASGYDVGKYSMILARLVALGWLTKPWNGRWAISERGRLVSALEAARRQRDMRRGRRSRRITVRKFMETTKDRVYKAATGTELALTG